ncbi:MAG: YdcF family protein [Desulfovibrio sp.]|jgi:uncharacterized SAM-binding protein YcdF (DUF218 family)
MRTLLGALLKLWGALSLLGLLAGAALLVLAGWWLPAEDELRPADAIVILAGDVRRSAHGADLYLRGLAPAVYLGRPFHDPPEPLCSLGLPCPRQEEVMQAVLAIKAVPPEAVHAYGDELLSTVEEAEALARALPPEARTIIVVTSPSHSRRAKVVLSRELPGRELLMSPTPHERFEREWWTHQASAKAVVLEVAKFAQYYLGQPFRTHEPETRAQGQTGGGAQAPQAAKAGS